MTQNNDSHDAADRWPLPVLAVRAGIAGVLMGLANLVPGVSGGTMLLAAGVYRRFITAIADVTTFRFNTRSLLTLACVVGCAGIGIVLLAGPVKDLVVNQRWIMYSLFVGLTLGGVPLVWKLVTPARPSVYASAFVAFALMAVMAFTGGNSSGGAASNMAMLFLAGVAGASAMILPGVSGGYLLLLLGQYVPILASVSRVKDALSARDVGGLMAEMSVVIPVGLGVVVGVVVVANALKWFLTRYEKPTLGVLLGLLFGAVVGLWPFQVGVPPEVGDTVKGQIVTAEKLEEIEADDYPVEYFTPDATQAIGSVALIFAGFALTVGLAHIGGGKRDEAQADA